MKRKLRLWEGACTRDERIVEKLRRKRSKQLRKERGISIQLSNKERGDNSRKELRKDKSKERSIQCRKKERGESEEELQKNIEEREENN